MKFEDNCVIFDLIDVRTGEKIKLPVEDEDVARYENIGKIARQSAMHLKSLVDDRQS